MSAVFETDSYNASHKDMYPEGMTEGTVYIECRDNCKFDNLTFVGLQYIIKEHLMKEDLTKLDLDYAEKRWNMHGEPFPREGWERIKELGYFPIEIQAVAEGSWIPKGNVLIQIRSTDPLCFWLPAWLETLIDQIWYPIAVSTQDKMTKAMLIKYLEDTGCEDIENVIKFMLHDFGVRGCPCMRAAAIGGMGHLVNFSGTDNFPAIEFIKEFYMEEMAGYSIPASNHAVITAWGSDQEYEAFQNILDKYLKPGAIVACVSDSYDIYAAVTMWGTRFHDQIVNSGGRLVIRPDSGNPEHVLLRCFNILFKYFGYTTTSTGHKLLPHCVRMIWGDGLSPKIIDQILYFLMCNDIAAENIAFGMGSAMLQEVKRDDVSLACKLNEKVDNGVVVPVNKDPVTGHGKASKAGRQALVRCDGYIFTVKEDQIGGRENLLRVVYRNGELLIDEQFSLIRERANAIGHEYYGNI